MSIQSRSNRDARGKIAQGRGGNRNVTCLLGLGCLLCLPATVWAEEVIVEVGSTNVMTGESFSTPVFIDGGTNFLGLYIVAVCYDTNVLELTEIRNGTNEFELFLANPNFPVFPHCEERGLNAAALGFGQNADTLVAPTGLVLAVEFDFLAVGPAGSSSELVLERVEVLDTQALPLPLLLLNGFVGITDGGDADGDGVGDAADACPHTAAGEAVNADGCSIAQLVPCSGPWKNHGRYVSTVVRAAKQFLAAGLITKAEKAAIVRQAAESDCGKVRGKSRPRFRGYLDTPAESLREP